MPCGGNTSTELAEEVVRLYRSKLTSRQIAAQVGLSKSGVLLILHRHVDVISSGESRKRSLHDYDLIPVMEVLDGELLGDGAYAWSNSSHDSARFDMTVAEVNKEHVELLHRILSVQMPLKLAPSKGWYDYKGQRIITDRVRLFSLFSHSLATQRQRWYGDGKKQAPDDLVLTPTVLRHWYYGDGSMSNGILFCSERYSEEVLERLREKLLALGFPTKRYMAHGRRGRLHMGVDASRRFLAHIGPCELDCYRHKWNMGLNSEAA